MKNFKKVTAAIAATLMAATMVAPVALNSFAAEEVTVTLTSDIEGAKLTNIKAYQIFNLEKVGDSDNYNVITWASDNMMTAAVAAYNAQQSEESGKINISEASDKIKADALKKVAGWLETNTNETAKIEAFAKAVVNNIPEGETGITVSNNEGTLKMTADTGYYVFTCDVQKVDGETTVEGYDAKSLGMLKVVDGNAVTVGNTGGVAKVGLPTVQKKVKENQDANLPVNDEGNILANHETDKAYNDIADYNIGNPVPFKLYGTLPQDYDKYETYYYEFQDTLDVQFTAPETTGITVKVDGNTIESSNYNVTIGDIKTDEVKTGTYIRIKFENLKSISSVTKDSVITVEYEAVLNDTAVVGKSGQDNAVKLVYSNNPNQQGEGETGETPDDKVRVYTYGFEFEKYFVTNGERSDITTEELNKWKSTGESAIQFELKDGTGADAQNIYVKATDEIGWNYVLAKSDEEGATTTIELFENETGKLSVKIKGLDEGTYYLTETQAPDGYNAVKDVKVEITADTGNTQDWGMSEDTLTKFDYTVGDTNKVEQTGENITGIAKGEIENKKGTTLPSTGGIGTTLFYLGGGAMVAVAGVFLITKKRMGKDEA